jgi:hypothetical protein
MGVATKDQVANLNIGGRTLKGNEFIGAIDDVLEKNVKGAMQRLGIKLVNELAKNSPADSGKLASSYSVLGVKETKTGYRLEIKVGVDYADYIDKGVRGVEHYIKNKNVYPNEEGKFYQFKNYYMPPEAIMQLQGWMQRKNMEIQATNLIEGRQTLPQISTEAKRLAFYIKKHGIEGKQFIKKSIDASVPDFQLDLRTIGQDTLILKIKK